MRKYFEKTGIIVLMVCMLVSGFSNYLPKVQAKEQLVNVATNEKVVVDVSKEDTSWGGLKTNINDGKLATAWKYPSASEWPVSAHLKLATSTNVKKIAIALGAGDANDAHNSVDVIIKYAQNGITSDLITFGTKKEDQLMSSTVEIEVETPVSATDVYVELSDPRSNGQTGGSFWPAIREFEVYEKQDIKISEYNNIASQATITTGGNNQNGSELVDNNYVSLYKMYGAPISTWAEKDRWVELDFKENRMIDAFELAFEHMKADPSNWNFTYSILGKAKEDSDYTELVKNATGNRVDHTEVESKITKRSLSKIKIVLHSITATNDPWPAFAEFKVYGSEVKIEDNESIAFKKPVHTNSRKSTSMNINDGSTKTVWKGEYYPGYVDIDLEENYNLDTIQVFTPAQGYSQYSIYTSMDGRDFDKLAEKTTKTSCPEAGEVYQANKKEARIIRVYMEYNSNAIEAIINEIRATGTKSGTAVQHTPVVAVENYANSKYNVPSITNQDTYDEVNGIIERRLGKQYVSWFDLELANNPDGTNYDYFELSNKNGKIHVKGNNGVSLSMGINHYLKYQCNVNVSQVGDQVVMPTSIKTLDAPIFLETKVKTRYSYNYCTLSYSMAFYGENEWRNEMDWLALNGVNVVLDATGQEEVWRRFLNEAGYSNAEAKDFVAGPAYYAWAYMANLSGYGGPVHDSWFEERTELARKNQLSMRKLGMQPALQGYSGMVPVDIKEHDANVDVIGQPTWCSFQRPSMLRTDSQSFEKYADRFYRIQKEVYGDVSDYYATDPFHEGGDTGGVSPKTVAIEVMDSMLKNDSNGIWIIQSWQGNPSSALLEGLEGNREHALVLDLYAEKTPHYNEGHPGAGSYGKSPEFDGTPWVYCMLNNFGGRLGLHGHLDNMANTIPEVVNTANHLAGIGIAPEASVNNPLLYDFLFETIWTKDASKTIEKIDVDQWLKDYSTRRYGAVSKASQEANLILKDTVYKAANNMAGQGAPESVVNARPGLDINAASTWGNANVGYDKGELERAASLMLKDYDKLKNSEGYLYDLATILQQVLSNSAQEYQRAMSATFRAHDQAGFKEKSDKFLSIIDTMEKVTSTSKYYLLGTWVEQAKALGKNADDFSRDLYEFNAKSLITTWGSKNQAETGGLKDYSNRQWSGLINDFYKQRWTRWIDARSKELASQPFESSVNWFEWEWEWARSNDVYTNVASNVNLKDTGKFILENFSVKNPAIASDYDVNPKDMSATAGDFQPNNTTEGGGEYVLDNNLNTMWHTSWGGSERSQQYIIFNLDKEQSINGLRYLPRESGNNGVITKFDIYVKSTNGKNEWTKVVENGTFDASNRDWQWVKFNPVNTKEVKFQVVDALSGEAGKQFATAREMRLMSDAFDVSKLASLITKVEALEKDDYTSETWSNLEAELLSAQAIVKQSRDQKEINDEVKVLQASVNALVKVKLNTSALNALITKVEALDSSIYTSETWSKLEKALLNAKNVVKNATSQSQINKEVTALQASINALQKAMKPEIKPVVPTTPTKPGPTVKPIVSQPVEKGEQFVVTPPKQEITNEEVTPIVRPDNVNNSEEIKNEKTPASFFNKNNMMIGGGIMLLLIGLFGFVYLRKRKNVMD
ncbi:MAG: alpha-N-acetylglucosaminidase TIM-barrel domain-containing protein [Erysipelotrichaceae bacterium]